MDNKNYLTECIFLLNDKLWYDEQNKIKEVKPHNWHHILKDYGWEKLHKQWIKKLNSYLKKPDNNSLYGALDCGGNGDCLFHCMSYAFNGDYDFRILRKELSESITEERYHEMIELYKILKHTGEFQEDWDPNEMDFKTFKTLIGEGGDKYWGDFLIINLLKEYLNINLVILNSDEYENEFYNYPLFYEYDEQLNTVVLLYENSIHFKLVGNFIDGNMVTLFTKKNIPEEILKLINHLR